MATLKSSKIHTSKTRVSKRKRTAKIHAVKKNTKLKHAIEHKAQDDNKAEAQSSSKKIMIIEDDTTISNMYKTGLTNYGYEVSVAQNGEEGLKMVKQAKPNIILLDVIMPKIDGFAVLTQLKADKDTKKIPVLMLTNLGQTEDKQRGKKLGAIDYIVKADFTPMQVSEKIKKYLK